MENEIFHPPINYKDLSLRVQTQIRRKFLPLCTEDEKQQVLETFMPMVHFTPSTVSNPSQHALVTAKIADQCQLLRWAVTCFVYGVDRIEAAQKNGEYVKANRVQLARFQLDKHPCIPLPKPPRRLRKTGQKRRASQAQPGDADDDNDGQRRVKPKTPLTQSNIPDLDANKKVREASHERSKSRLMERESVIDSRENDLNNREANLMKREADLERSETELTYRKSAVDSREAALDRREASVVQREADLESTLSTRQTASDSRSADLEHRETAMNHRLEALNTKETELNNREVVLETRNTELNNCEAAMDTRNIELNNREAAMDTRGCELNNREVVQETRNTELNNCEAAMETRNTELNNREVVLETRNTKLNNYEAAMDTRNTELNNREAALDARGSELNNREVVLETRNTKLNNREAAMDIRDAKPKNHDTVLHSYETDLGHCEVVINSRPADLASCEAALESYEIGQDGGEARLQGREMDPNNLEADMDSQEAHLGRRKSGIDNRMATSSIGASQPDSACKQENDEDSATPQAQAGPRFDGAYIEEYQKCYNRAILDITILRGLSDAARINVEDENFHDTLMEEFDQRMESLANATNSARRVFACLFWS
ncbi:hypothetical protein MY11210_005859 [Beauveria gryllotalpidicola]